MTAPKLSPTEAAFLDRPDVEEGMRWRLTVLIGDMLEEDPRDIADAVIALMSTPVET